MKSFFLVFCFAFAISCKAAEEPKEFDNIDVDDLLDELYTVIENGTMREVQSLIDRGVQLNVSKHWGEDDKYFYYPLHGAIEPPKSGEFNGEILTLLIKSGAELEALDDEGRTPLYKAVDEGIEKAVKILLENGANPNTICKKENISALQQAFLESSASDTGDEVIVLLIEHGADVNQKDKDGETLLHEAIYKGYRKAIELLVEKGANLSATEYESQMTPLHYLALFDIKNHNQTWTDDDKIKYAELLISHGADADAKANLSGDDFTALDFTDSPKLKEFLRSKMKHVKKSSEEENGDNEDAKN